MVTRLELTNQLLVLCPDAAIDVADVISIITSAHHMFPGNYFIDHSDETLTFASNVYEYDLPEISSVISAFTWIHSLYEESDVTGYFERPLLRNLWDIQYVPSGVHPAGQWVLSLSRDTAFIPGKKIRIIGQRKYVYPTADASVLELHPGWLLEYCLALMHASTGGSSSDMASWHQRMAGFHMANAQQIHSNIDNRVRPGSTRVPGVLY